MKWEIVAVILVVLFLILIGGCAAKPVAAPVDLHWQFCDVVPNEPLACLKEDDVKRLRQALIECRGRK